MSRQAVMSAVRVVTADGWPASVREVQAVSGHASPSTVQVHLERLEADGWVARHPRRKSGGWMPGLRRDGP